MKQPQLTPLEVQFTVWLRKQTNLGNQMAYLQRCVEDYQEENQSLRNEVAQMREDIRYLTEQVMNFSGDLYPHVRPD